MLINMPILQKLFRGDFFCYNPFRKGKRVFKGKESFTSGNPARNVKIFFATGSEKPQWESSCMRFFCVYGNFRSDRYHALLLKTAVLSFPLANGRKNAAEGKRNG